MATQLPAWRFLLLVLIGLVLATGLTTWLASPVILALLERG